MFESELLIKLVLCFVFSIHAPVSSCLTGTDSFIPNLPSLVGGIPHTVTVQEESRVKVDRSRNRPVTAVLLN